MADRRVIITPEPFGVGFDIKVEPAPEWANFDCERPTVDEARRYAAGLRTVHGWKVVDRSGEMADG